MLILLPPSEGKTAPEGPALDLAALSFARLTPSRDRLLSALTDLCRTEPARAQRALKLTAGLVGEVARNADLRTAATAPAIDVYSGVLYDAFDYATLSAPQRRRVASRVAIASGLWGLIRAGDPIPAYRLSGSTSLPGVGPLAAYWREQVSAELVRIRGLIVDLRSSAYVALGPLPPGAARCVTVSVYDVVAGRRVSISHSNKATKGLLARALIRDATDCGTAQELVEHLTEQGFEARLLPGEGGASRIDVRVLH